MSHPLALVGLPHAGKTVWLGRIWHAVDLGKRKLQKRGQPADLEPLKKLGDDLMEGTFPDRSPSVGAPRFVVPLRWVSSPPVELELVVADYNGEELEALWTQRDLAWSQAWEERAQAEGVVLFVRADQIERPTAERLRPSSLSTAAKTLFPDTQPDEDFVDRPRLHAPTAVALVELLQLLRHARGLRPGELQAGWKVAVVLTAWDAVDPAKQKAGPTEFLREELGLLDDMIATNFGADNVRVFGLSAVGGNLKDPTYKEIFAGGEVDDHGWLCWDQEGLRWSNDITLPVGWMLCGDAALEGIPWEKRPQP